jgi:hypothetical protein
MDRSSSGKNLEQDAEKASQQGKDDPVSPLCSRNARPKKDGEGNGQKPFLLAERALSECARSMRAVKGSLGHSLNET